VHFEGVPNLMLPYGGLFELTESKFKVL